MQIDTLTSFDLYFRFDRKLYLHRSNHMNNHLKTLKNILGTAMWLFTLQPHSSSFFFFFFFRSIFLDRTSAIIFNPIKFNFGTVINHHLKKYAETFWKREVIRGHVTSIQKFILYGLITAELYDRLLSNFVCA